MEGVERPDDQRVAAGAGDVEGFDAGQLVVGEGAEVDRLGVAVNRSRSVPEPPSILRKARSGTLSRSSPAPERITSLPRRRRGSRCRPAEEDVVPAIAVGDHRRGRAADSAAEDDVAVAGTAAAVVAGKGSDDQVVEAVAVDVAGRGDRAAGPIVRIARRG